MRAVDFLTTLYSGINDGWLEITLISPPELELHPRVDVKWKPFPLEIRDEKLTQLHKLNERGYGVYFGLAVRREKKLPEWRENPRTGERRYIAHPRAWQRDSVALTALFVDVDAKDFKGDLDAARRAVESINPSIIVASGAGFHGYLCFDTPLAITDDNRGEIKRTLKGLSLSIGGDSHVAELARVFRMPDTINTKPGRDGARCRVLVSTSRRYRYQDLHDEYAPLIPIHTPRQHDLRPGDEDEVERALALIPPDKIGYDEWIAILAGLTHSLGEREALVMGERWTDWCSERGEVASKIASFSGDTGSSLASIGTVFHIAKRFGYARTRPNHTSSMTPSNKSRIATHIQEMTGR